MKESKQFIFKPCTFKLWKGRYNRIIGKTTTFKIKYTTEHGFWPVVEWDMGDEKTIYLAHDSNSVKELNQKVNNVKLRLSGNEGGAFVINEFGQVIVPSSKSDGERFLVGEVEGLLIFKDPYNSKMIDFSDDTGLLTGALWDRPYIGMQYNLHSNSSIYCFNNELESSVYPPEQDRELIKKLRKVRRYGPTRFIVNHYGIVLTKIPEGDYHEVFDNWVPIYIGRINRKLWFIKED